MPEFAFHFSDMPLDALGEVKYGTSLDYANSIDPVLRDITRTVEWLETCEVIRFTFDKASAINQIFNEGIRQFTSWPYDTPELTPPALKAIQHLMEQRLLYKEKYDKLKKAKDDDQREKWAETDRKNAERLAKMTPAEKEAEDKRLNRFTYTLPYHRI